MSETELTMHRPLTPEELNQSLARRDRPTPPKQPSEADTFRMLGSFVQTRIDKATAPLKEEIEKLKKTIEQRRYVGVWATGKYYEGNMVTLDGSIFHCNVAETTQRPGTGPDWTLAIKRGQNGRDGVDANRRPTMQRSG
jgi:hypothetical protein